MVPAFFFSDEVNMQLYRAKVCLGGSPYNQVIKEGLSAAEVIILHRIHNAVEGTDGSAVKEIAKWDPPKDHPKRTLKLERGRLLSLYGANFVKTFPNEFQALPEALDDSMLAGAAPVVDDDEEVAAAMATEKDVRKILSVPKSKGAQADAAAAVMS